VVGDLRDGEVVGPHLLSKPRLLQTLQAQVEPRHGKALHTQSGIPSCDQLNCVSESSLMQAAQRRAAIGQEREVPHVVALVA